MHRKLKKSILVVDDDEATRILIHEVFEGTGIEIIDAENGNEGLSLFKKHAHEISLAVLDIHLPGYNGWELLKFFHQENALVPIVILSAIQPYEHKKDQVIMGYDAYILKPFAMKELKKIILDIIALY